MALVIRLNGQPEAETITLVPYSFSHFSIILFCIHVFFCSVHAPRGRESFFVNCYQFSSILSFRLHSHFRYHTNRFLSLLSSPDSKENEKNKRTQFETLNALCRLPDNLQFSIEIMK